MPIYRGLNIGKGMIDIDNPVEALTNLGLSIDDLDMIKGLTSDAAVDIKDFHVMANLTVDQEKVFGSMQRTAEQTAVLTDSLTDISVPMDTNIFLNSQLAGSAIKYNYTDFNVSGAVDWDIKKADISTSRISSWSPVGPEPTPDSKIFYGGDVGVESGEVAYAGLRTTKEPLPRSFRAEVPTHILKIEIDDTVQQFLAMKGIPLIFNGHFQDCDFSASVVGIQDSAGQTIPITWRITNTDSTGTVYSSGDGSGGTPSIGIGTITSPAIYPFRDGVSRPRQIEFFYNPSKIEQIKMSGSGIVEWTNVVLPNLKILDLELCELGLIPCFRGDSTLSAQAKHGVISPNGLAPNLEEIVLSGNNLSRGPQILTGLSEVSAGSEGIYGTANAQLNRLPLSIKKINVNGCFSDSTPVDLTDYKFLESFSMGVTYLRDLSRSMSDSTVMPAPWNSEKASTGFISWNDNFATIANTRIRFNNLFAIPAFFDGEITGSFASLSDGDFVYVKYFNGGKKVSGTEVGELPTNYPSGATGSGLVPGNVYKLVYKGVSTSSTSGGLELRTVPGDTLVNTLLRTTDSDDPGNHCFKLCESNGDIKYNDTYGIKYYNTYRQGFEQVPPGIMNSSKLQELEIFDVNIRHNSERPCIYANGSSGAVQDAVSADRAIQLRSTEITRIKSGRNYFPGTHNVIDMSGKLKLKEYHHERGTMRYYRAAERTVNGKFTNCPALEKFEVIGLNCIGDPATNGMFQDKPVLNHIDIRYTSMGDCRLRDDMFGENTQAVKRFYMAGWSYGAYNKDLLGTDGSANRTGKAFVNMPSLERLYIYNSDRACIRFVTDDDHYLDLSQNTNLKVFVAGYGGATGKLPDFANNDKLYYIYAGKGKSNLQMRWVQPDIKHEITNLYLGGGNRNMNTQLWTDIGWTNVNPVTGESQGTNGGADPAIGDVFVGKVIEVANTPLIGGKVYRIYDKGNTSLADWNAITGQNKSSLQDYGYSTTHEGYVFTAPGTGPNLATISGTGTVRPDTYARAKTFGLDEPLPAWDNPSIRWVYLMNNSIPGQIPKFNCPRLWRFWANRNKFTGDIPDFSDCRDLTQLRLQDNQISGYVAGNLATNKYLRNVNLRNNKLGAGIATDLINDLYANYLLRKRGGVSIDLLGQNSDSAESLSESSIINDGTTGELSSANKLAALRNAGWSILLDP